MLRVKDLNYPQKASWVASYLPEIEKLVAMLGLSGEAKDILMEHLVLFGDERYAEGLAAGLYANGIDQAERRLHRMNEEEFYKRVTAWHPGGGFQS